MTMDSTFEKAMDSFAANASNSVDSVDLAKGLLVFVAGFGIILGIFALIFGIIRIVSWWKIFVKAGKPGWASLIPIYNLWVLYEIVGLPGWIALLAFIPVIGSFIVFVTYIVAAIRLPEYFGKQPAFALGLIFLPIIFYPMLAFGPCEYNHDLNKVETI